MAERISVDRLDESQCWELLASAALGRVGTTLQALPVVLPVVFATDDHNIVFRVAREAGFAAACLQAPMAFEVDHMETASDGWSVLAIGQARPAELTPSIEAVALGLPSWADADHLLVLAPQVLTGRRLRQAMPE